MFRENVIVIKILPMCEVTDSVKDGVRRRFIKIKKKINGEVVKRVIIFCLNITFMKVGVAH
ncbi:hypothetical protein DGG96_18970 [Legionella qingyii]|uniref:Uncharacterized protein n=1 Tax=Legionella qingyii TaxID=2184757 RepID=A0A317TX95_9GAMM|nr:hypothetical protein DGG96_18970 [Legionella qingyii]